MAINMSSYGAFSKPVSIRGIPVLNMHGRNVYWVDSGGPGGTKGTYQNPLKTIDAATTLCQANRGDIVYIKPGHSETITGAGGITFDKAGVYYVGLGTYDLRPAFLMDGASTVTCLVTAANVHVENMIFRAGDADVAVFTTITGKGCAFVDCHFEDNTSGENFKTIFSVGAAANDADGLLLQDNVIVQGDVADLHAIIFNANESDVSIISNRISGDYDTSPYAPIYGSTSRVLKNCLVAGNLIHNQHNANAAVGISLAATANTGWIVHNFVGHQDSGTETPILAATGNGLYVGENYCSGVLGTASGYLYPTKDSA